VNAERMQNDGREANFHTTHGSLVLAAACQNQAPESWTAFAELCQVYWYPLYAHVRRRGYDPEDAKGLTQSFFLQLIEHEALAQVDSRKGKFRSFLRASLNKFLAVAHRRDNAIKRGGGQELLSLNVADAEGRYRVESADRLSAEQTFDARWALSLLNESMRQLEENYGEKPQTFQVLKSFLLPGSQTVSTWMAGDFGRRSKYAEAVAEEFVGRRGPQPERCRQHHQPMWQKPYHRRRQFKHERLPLHFRR